MSSLVTVTTEGVAATAVPAVASNILGTLVSSTEAVTGMYGFVQKALIFGAGMSYQNHRVRGSWNPLQAA